MTIIVACLLTIFFIILSIIGISTTISDGLLAITAIIIVWYTAETRKMRKEITKQNVLLARPAVIVELTDQKIFLKNDGKGPALNIQLSYKFTEFKYFKNKASDEKPDNIYHIPIVSYLAPTLNKEVLFFKEKGTLSEPGEFFEFGKIWSFLITYNDIEEIRYQTKIEIESGQLKTISFK
jgi:hypothetical protein